MNQDKDKKLKNTIQKIVNKNLAGLFLKVEDLEERVKRLERPIGKVAQVIKDGDPDLYKHLKMICIKKGMTVEETLKTLIKIYVEDNERK